MYILLSYAYYSVYNVIIPIVYYYYYIHTLSYQLSHALYLRLCDRDVPVGVLVLDAVTAVIAFICI